ncbi:MAG: Rpn family recombination-promoting nuclease/putative transposase [Magnetospirillum sp.]|nr:Rpn family recombination-promoting nuclease/putative transposase [Magnetospirillum sp.]
MRTQVYEGLLWQHVIAEKKLKPGDRLPPVLMLVLYNGEQRWSAPADVASLIALSPDSPLWPWQPQVRYHLLDMGAMPDDELASRDSLAALLFRLEHPHEPEELAHLIDEVVGWFRRYSGYDDLKRLFTELVRQAIEGYEPSVVVPGDMMEMRSMLANLGETWKKRWKAEGVAEGRTEGEAFALIRLVEKRFGPLPANLRERILAADAASVEAWLDRLMEAPSLEVLFSTTN